MGSSYFYLEFLLAWLSTLSESGFKNPAIFALEYTLVPDRTFPTQLQEAIAGYSHVLSMVGDASRICVSGDSAGATVMLSLLLHLAKLEHDAHKLDGTGAWRLARPGMAALISPWITLLSRNHRNTASDYLDEGRLHHYAREYVGAEIDPRDALVSPGDCRDAEWWSKACPSGGMYIAYGAEEVFAPDIEEMVAFLKDKGIDVRSREEPGGIHAWPVASLFLSTSIAERQKGLRSIVQEIRGSMLKAPV
jgi:acetyl esterase/lipase